MNNIYSFNVNGVDSSINLADSSNNGLMSFQDYKTLSDISSGINLDKTGAEVIYPNDVMNIINQLNLIDAKVDNENKLLESTDINGNKRFYTDVSIDGVLKGYTIDTINTIIENHSSEILDLSLNSLDGSIINSVQTFELVDSVIWMNAMTDDNGKILKGTYTDGTSYFSAIKSPTIDDISNNIGDIKNSIETETNLNGILTVSADLNMHDSSNISGDVDYIESDNIVYIGYKNTFSSNAIIKEFKISLYGASSLDVNTSYTFALGTIDQRNWLLPRTTFDSNVSSVKDGMICFDFSSEYIIAKEGEVLFIYAHKTSAAMTEGINKIVELYNNSNRNSSPYYTTDLSVALTSVTSQVVLFPDIKTLITYQTFDGVISNKLEFETLSEIVSSNTSNISKKQNTKLVDVSTGIPYRLLVKDGVLTLKSLHYDKVCCIGNSFTRGWYNRTLCATVPETAYYSYMKDVMGTSVMDNTTWNTVERSLLNTDFTNILNKDNEYDAIVLQLGENIVSTDADEVYQTFIKVYQALKANWPEADIYSVFGRLWNNRPTHICLALEQAAADEDVPLVDCSDISLVDHMLQRDYAYDTGNNLVEVSDAAYASHPSDVGCYRIAQRILDLMGYGYEIPDRLFNITKNQNPGGTILTAANYWISQGIVTIQCVPNDGYTISDVSVITISGETIDTTISTNTLNRVCYVFIMPTEDVILTPTWTTTE